MNKTKPVIDLLNGPIDSTLRQFSFPMVISFLINNMYTWIDTYYISRLGTHAIAAIGICEQILFFLFTIGSGFAIGTGIMVSRRIGEGRQQRAEEIATQALIITFVFSAIIAIVFFIFKSDLLNIMHVRGLENEYAIKYLSTIVIGLPFNFMIVQISYIIRSAGDSIFPMKIMIFSTILNAVIAPFLIFGITPFPRLDMMGAGLSTALAQIISSIIGLVMIFMHKTPMKLKLKGLKFEHGVAYKIFKLGLPASLQMLAISLNRMSLFFLANMYGASVVAVYTLGLKLDLFVFMPIFGFGTALSITTGQNLGARKIERIFDYYKSSIKQIGIFSIVLGILVFFGGSYFASIFTNDPNIIAMTHTYFRFTSLTYLFFTIGFMSVRVIVGAGATIRSFLMVTLVLFVLQMPLAYIIAKVFDMHQNGIWLAILISQLVFSIVGAVNVYGKKWLKVKV